MTMSEYNGDYFGDYQEKAPSPTAHAVLSTLGSIATPAPLTSEQKLHLQRIVATREIPLADRVELMRMLGLIGEE